MTLGAAPGIFFQSSTPARTSQRTAAARDTPGSESISPPPHYLFTYVNKFQFRRAPLIQRTNECPRAQRQNQGKASDPPVTKPPEAVPAHQSCVEKRRRKLPGQPDHHKKVSRQFGPNLYIPAESHEEDSYTLCNGAIHTATLRCRQIPAARPSRSTPHPAIFAIDINRHSTRFHFCTDRFQKVTTRPPTPKPGKEAS